MSGTRDQQISPRAHSHLVPDSLLRFLDLSHGPAEDKQVGRFKMKGADAAEGAEGVRPMLSTLGERVCRLPHPNTA